MEHVLWYIILGMIFVEIIFMIVVVWFMIFFHNYRVTSELRSDVTNALFTWRDYCVNKHIWGKSFDGSSVFQMFGINMQIKDDDNIILIFVASSLGLKSNVEVSFEFSTAVWKLKNAKGNIESKVYEHLLKALQNFEFFRKKYVTRAL